MTTIWGPQWVGLVLFKILATVGVRIPVLMADPVLDFPYDGPLGASLVRFSLWSSYLIKSQSQSDPQASGRLRSWLSLPLLPVALLHPLHIVPCPTMLMHVLSPWAWRL